jgi:CRISPR-associated protein Csb1
MSKLDLSEPLQPQLLAPDGPVCLILTARLVPVGNTDRFQPAGFPEVGHVIYDAPRTDANGRKYKEKVCIVDSPASMANHLEKVCLAGEGTVDLHADLSGLPYVVCVTDSDFETQNGEIVPKKESRKNSSVVSTFTEGHRLASDYFLDAHKLTNGEPAVKTLREELRDDFKIIEVKKDKTYFIPPTTWWEIYKTIFKFDPNALVHGVMFAKEQIKISRLLTAHMEAIGASRVGRSGVKFDRLGKTTSGQPIFSIDEETAEEIRATFILDLALLRSYARGESGLNSHQKQLLLDLAIWKIAQVVTRPFRFRTQCFLKCELVTVSTEDGLLPKPTADESETKRLTDEEMKKAIQKSNSQSAMLAAKLIDEVKIAQSIANCKFESPITEVYYPANELFKAGKETDTVVAESNSDEDTSDS